MGPWRWLGLPLLLVAARRAAAFLPVAVSRREPLLCSAPSPLRASGDEGGEWMGYGNDGTNDLQRLRVKCYHEEKGQVIDPWQLSDFLLIEAGAYSSFIEDADAGSEAESPIFGEPGEPLPKVKIWQRSTVAADYPMDMELDEVVDLIEEAFSLDERPIYSVEVIRDRDWVTEVQEGWKPIPIGDSLLVRFPWHTEADLEGLMTDDRHALLLEGGAAFGSGEHATTVMCCQWLEQHLSEHKGASVMDYGSGSGILGLASLLFGAGRVDGVEIDTMAIDSAYRNARMNGLSMPFYVPLEENGVLQSWATVPEGGLASSTAVDLRRQPYDVCVANILARPLIELSDVLRDLTRPNGFIVLAGLLNEQVDAVMAAYKAKGFDMSHINSMGDWALLVGRRQK